MTVIKDAVRSAMEALPAIALSKLLRRKAKEAGVGMPKEVAEALAQHVIMRAPGGFSWEQRRGEGVHHIELAINETDLKELDAIVAQAAKAVPSAIAEASDAVSQLYFDSLCENWVAESGLQLEEIAEFRERLEERWGDGLGYLRMLLTCCREMGRETFKRHRRSRSRRHTHRRWAMLRLHARACQVADEEICLMENGFADGAMARWRTLHELAVVAAVISEGDDDLAER